MNVKNDISEELRALSEVVASISRETPYRVPEGYFSNFPALVLPRVVKPLTFSVPDGYFEGFAQQVLNRIKTGSGPSTGTEEADELPAILAQAARVTPYAVPEGYFESLSPILAILNKKNPYAVPEGYFEGLASEVNGVVAARDLAAEAQKEGQRKAKVVSLGSRRSWLKYSAAAVMAGLIVTAGWLRLHPSAEQHNLAQNTSQNGVEIAKNLTKVSDAELQNFLVDQDTTLAQPVLNNAAMATLDMNDADMKNLLGDVPDRELKQYMEEHGGGSDVATN